MFRNAAIDRRKLTLWVIHVISNVREGLPVYTQHRTYRCTALTDEKGHERTSCAATTSGTFKQGERLFAAQPRLLLSLGLSSEFPESLSALMLSWSAP